MKSGQFSCQERRIVLKTLYPTIEMSLSPYRDRTQYYLAIQEVEIAGGEARKSPEGGYEKVLVYTKF